MRRISLKSMHLESFRSFLAPTDIDFGDPGGFRMLYGQNLVEPRLGGNGAGKSTIWDALCWCLYGTSARGLKSSDLVSWGATAQIYVSVDLEINDNIVTLQRWGNPNRLHIDGEHIEQAALEADVICMSRTCFLQSVLFGQLVRLFIDITAAERGALLDDILNLEIWGQAADTAAKEAKLSEAAVNKLIQELSYAKGQLAGLMTDEQLAELESGWQSIQDQKSEALIKQIEQAEQELSLLEQKATQLSATKEHAPKAEGLSDNLKEVERRIQDLRSRIAVLEADQVRKNKELQFFENAPTECPTCAQPISSRFVGTQKRSIEFAVQEIRKDRDKLKSELAHDLCGVDSMCRVIDQRNAELRNAETEASRATGELRAHTRMIESFCSQAEMLMQEQNPYTAQRSKSSNMRKTLTRSISTTNIHIASVRSDLQAAEYWKQGFKRVRLFQTQQSLSMLQAEIANAASSLGLVGWKIELVTATETKSGTIKQGVQVTVSSPLASGTWEMWSGGEGQRIRLAVAIGLASMIQRSAGIFYSFEVWDEPSAWLSPEGIDDLLDCLAARAKVTNKTVWILDHRALSHAGFDEVWQVSKGEQGSTIDRVS